MAGTNAGQPDDPPAGMARNIGLAGFEPAASCTRGRRSTKLSHSPNLGTAKFDGTTARTYLAYFAESGKNRKTTWGIGSASMISVRCVPFFRDSVLECGGAPPLFGVFARQPSKGSEEWRTPNAAAIIRATIRIGRSTKPTGVRRSVLSILRRFSGNLTSEKPLSQQRENRHINCCQL